MTAPRIPMKANDTRRARQNDRPFPMPVQVRAKVWLERDGEFVIGEGGLHLLTEVEALGSLSAAVRQIGWSYRHAWQYLCHIERVLGSSLVVPRPGKGARRGTVLTPAGKRVLELLGEVSGRVARTAGATWPTREEIAARVRGRPKPPEAQRGKTVRGSRPRVRR